MEDQFTTKVHERTRQRRFTYATWLSHRAVASIERAQFAATMLREGVSINDTIAIAGFSDQPHLTRSLKVLIGVAPGQLMKTEDASQLSFISRTEPDGAGRRASLLSIGNLSGSFKTAV